PPPPTVSPEILQGLFQPLLDPVSSSRVALSCALPEVERAWEQLHHGLIQRMAAGAEELPKVIYWALVQARRLLDVDRLLIYQFQARLQSVKVWRGSESLSGDRLWETPQWQELSDGVTYEARRDGTVPSVLYQKMAAGILDVDRWGGTQSNRGHTGAIADSWDEQAVDKAVRKLTNETPIRAQLAVAISGRSPTGEDPWGLLVAQTVDQARQWSDQEELWLKRLAQILTLGIYQGQVEASGKQNQQKMEQTLHDQGEALQYALTQAETAAHAKSEFLAAVSHELRTPLTCVIGLSDTLLRWSLDNFSPKQQEYLHTIHDSGEHLKRLVDDILEVAQLGSGLAMLRIREFSVSQVLLQSIAQVQEQFGDRPRTVGSSARNAAQNIASEFQLSTAEDRFWADRQRVQQIVTNLLSNAAKFTPHSGQIILRAWRENRGLIIQVEDTVIGIPSEQIPSLFEQFHQLEASYQRVHGGLGMGLGLTKQLVELHGGSIEVSSVVNQGSIFTVWLPDQHDLSGEDFSANGENKGAVNTITGTTNGAHAPLGTGWTKKNVMLIDGHGERPLILCNLLTAAGHDVVWLDDGAMAIAQFKAVHPDLVILSLEAQGRKEPLSTAEQQSGEFNPLFEQLDIVPTLRQRGGQRLKILILGDQARGDEVNWWLAQWTAPTAGVTLGDRPLIDAYLSHQSGSNEFLEVVTGLLDTRSQPVITDPTAINSTAADSLTTDENSSASS
ncbi:MAG: ATP-binding protein, partial [Cyanobacteria bacterium P01_F01_bin.153]